MPVKDEHITIPKKVGSGDDLDYSFLKEKGLEYVQQLSHDIWSDYNEHDPGITILELLSYAITDLGMRINMPVEDILAGNEGMAGQFFSAQEILPSQPVTLTDYRKLFIDIDGVKNCWLKPFEKSVFVDCKKDWLAYTPFQNGHEQRSFSLQGLYEVILDVDDPEDETAVAAIKKNVEKVYHANRNLCEDLAGISVVEEQKISVCARIDVNPEADEELIHAKVLHAIRNYFSPSVRFYSLKQMIEKGYSVDEVFEGPLLRSGFIDDRELDKAGLKTEVRLSDIIQLIMQIDGVNVIKEITISGCDGAGDGNADKWVLCVDDGKKPVLCEKSAFSYYKGVLPVNINHKRVGMYLDEIVEAENAGQEFSPADLGPEVPHGSYLEIEKTTTIQNDLPDTYGTGQTGMPASADTARKAKAKQLKGYLLFFDQILASYFAHLGKVKELLSVRNTLDRTYFTKPVEDVKGLEGLLSGLDILDDEQLTKALFENIDKNIERKNILLDHLIARFAENMNDYVFLMKKLYGPHSAVSVREAKERMLSEYGDTDGRIGISNGRGSAFDYQGRDKEYLWDTDNVSGVQKRISLLAGIKDYRRRNLSLSFVDVYEFADSHGHDVYRWRVRNMSDDIVLSSTENYDSRRAAEAELYFAVLKIVDMPVSVVKKAFESTVADEQEIGNFEVQISPEGKYSFDVINADEPESSVNHVIARQFTYYDTQEELRDAMLDLIGFFTSDFTEEGMFVVEHILLRPDITRTNVPHNQFMPVCTDGCSDCEPVDPYSFRVTVVLPGWTYRFSDPDFRTFMEELIRYEMPAHVLARVCWIGDRKVHRENDDENELTEMELFENAYKEFLFARTNTGQGQNITKQKNLIKILSNLNSVYPAGTLIDCEDEEDRSDNKIVLGNTHIGNL